MKTQIKTSQKKTLNTFNFIGLMVIFLLGSPIINAQTEKNVLIKQDINTLTVKGVISDETGILPGANIILKDTNIGTASDKNGAYIFPRALKAGDILIVSYLGYTTQQLKVKNNTTTMNVFLAIDALDIIGDLATETVYKTKHSE